jgi:hypothetical protein
MSCRKILFLITIIFLLNSCITYNYKFIQLLPKKNQQISLQDYNELVDEVSSWGELNVSQKCSYNQSAMTVYRTVENDKEISKTGAAVKYAADAGVLVYAMAAFDGFSNKDDRLFESAKKRLKVKFGENRAVVKDSLFSGKNELRDIFNKELDGLICE